MRSCVQGNRNINGILRGKILTHLKLAELMARHGVTGQDLAKTLNVSETTVSHWKAERKLPAIKALDAIAAAITKLSKIGEIVRGIDLLEDR